MPAELVGQLYKLYNIGLRQDNMWQNNGFWWKQGKGNLDNAD